MVFAATQRLLKALDDFSEEVGSLKGQLAGDLKVGSRRLHRDGSELQASGGHQSLLGPSERGDSCA